MDEFETEKFSPLVSELDEECRAGRLPLPQQKMGEKNNGTQIRFEEEKKTSRKTSNIIFMLRRRRKWETFSVLSLDKVAN